MSLKTGRPSKAETSKLHDATEEEMQALQDACIFAIVSGARKIQIKQSRLTRFPKGFPKGITKEDLGTTKVIEYDARRVIKWMEKEGKCSVTLSDVARAQQSYHTYLQWLEKPVSLDF